MTGMKLELLTDIDMVFFIEKGVRGGVLQVSNRFKQDNNPYVDGFDCNKPTSCITYEDTTNLYGLSMSNSLLCSDFRWLTEQEINTLDIQAIKDDSEIGYILSVDLQYPSNIHDFTNDYPLCPEKKHVADTDVSPYCQSLWKKLHETEDKDNFYPKRAEV